jgi:phosphonate transport system permease protein
MSAATVARRPFPTTTVVLVAALVAAAVACTIRLDMDVASLFSKRTLDAAGETVSRMWPPRLEASTLADVESGVVETLSMSVVGTLLGAAIGLALMPFCCETLFVRGPLAGEETRTWGARAAALALHQTARFVANVLRTVPYFAWAMLFWFMVGQGVFPGALAIAVHTGGVIARNYAQVLDHVDLGPCLALRDAGARRRHVFLFGMLPAARAALASFTLYRWEVNIRESTVLGLVGTVGLGFHLKYAFGTFDWKAAATHLAAIVVLVLAVDALSTALRKRMM